MRVARKRWLALGVAGNLRRARDLQVRELRCRERQRARAGARDHAHCRSRPIPLPLGISFFTFHAISYVVDVYKRNARAERSLSRLRALHPAVSAAHRRPDHPLARHRRRSSPRRDERAGRLRLRRAPLRARPRQEGADRQHARPRRRPHLRAAGGRAHHAARLARPRLLHAADLLRLLRLLGHGDRPRCACSASASSRTSTTPTSRESIREFWRRWHISLSTWFRDYLYIPLGGNRRGAGARVREPRHRVPAVRPVARRELAVRALGRRGTALFLVLERAGLGRVLERLGPLSHAYALLVVMGGWVLFRCEHARAGGRLLRGAARTVAGRSGAASARPNILDPLRASRRSSSPSSVATPLARASGDVAAIARAASRAPARRRRSTADSAWLVAGVRRRGGVPRRRHLQPVHLLPVLMRRQRNRLRASRVPAARVDAPSPPRPAVRARVHHRARRHGHSRRSAARRARRWTAENRTMAPWPRWHSSRDFPPRSTSAFADRFGGRETLLRGPQPRAGSPVRRFAPRRTCMIGRDGWLYFLGEDGHVARPPLPRHAAGVRCAVARRRRGIAAAQRVARGERHRVRRDDRARTSPRSIPSICRAGQRAADARTPLDRLVDAIRADGSVRFVDLRAAAARGEGARARLLRDRLALEPARRRRRVRRDHARSGARAAAGASRSRVRAALPPYVAGRRRLSRRPRAADRRSGAHSASPTTRRSARCWRHRRRVARSAPTSSRTTASSATRATRPACRARSCTATRWRSR